METTGSGMIALNVIGAGIVAVLAFRADPPVWALILCVVALIAWVVRAVARARSRLPGVVEVALVALMVIGGALSGAATDGAGVTVCAIGILVALGTVDLRMAVGGAITAIAAALLPVGTWLGHGGWSVLIPAWCGCALAVAAGVSRRQFRQSERQRVQLAEQEIALREEASRIAIARDLHDVLAHSLGGLVSQLDAVDALLEAGAIDDAGSRVRVARTLAADGLRDARRAVAALRNPDQTPVGTDVTTDSLRDSIADLTAAHRALGGVLTETIDVDTLPTLPGDVAAVIGRIVQESLSNARHHAPGLPVDLAVTVDDRRAIVEIGNPLAPDVPAGQGDEHRGYGLTGMRERLAALVRPARFDAGPADGRFSVRAEISLTQDRREGNRDN